MRKFATSQGSSKPTAIFVLPKPTARLVLRQSCLTCQPPVGGSLSTELVVEEGPRAICQEPAPLHAMQRRIFAAMPLHVTIVSKRAALGPSELVSSPAVILRMRPDSALNLSQTRLVQRFVRLGRLILLRRRFAATRQTAERVSQRSRPTRPACLG